MSKRYEVKFYIGTGYDKAGKMVDNVVEKSCDARVILTGYFQGFTEYDHTGVWAETPTSLITTEPGLTFVAVVKHADLIQVRECAAKLRDLFNQTCVLVTADEISAEFV